MRNLATRFAAIAMAAVIVLPTLGWCGAEEDARVVPLTEPDSATPTGIDLLEVVIVGNTVLSEKTIYEVVEPLLGPGKTLDEVDRIREALEERYRDSGYRTVSVRIPKQSARGGTVRLDVIENRIGRLNVIGSNYHSLERIKALAPSVAVGAVPNFERIQQDLIVLNTAIPNLRVTPALKPGLRPETLDVDLAVDDELPLRATVEVNNRHSQDTAPLRSQLGLSYGDLWQRGHSASFTYQIAPQEPDQSTVLFGSYLARFATSPASVMLSYIKSESAVSTIGGINVLGNGEIYGLRLFAPLEGTTEIFPTVTLGVDYKKFRSITALPDAGQGAQSFKTPVTYYPFSLGVGVLWRQLQGVTQSDVSLNFASPQLGSDAAELDNNRYRARGQQFSVRGSLGHQNDLPLAMQVAVRAAMQVTDQPLIATEQFSAGGADSVRGYLEAAALGDQGIVGSLELRSPSLTRLGAFGAFSDFRLFSFYDDASLKLHDVLPEQTAAFRLSSWGVGARFAVQSIEAAMQWADPLRDLPSKEPEPSRLLFRMTGSF